MSEKIKINRCAAVSTEQLSYGAGGKVSRRPCLTVNMREGGKLLVPTVLPEINFKKKIHDENNIITDIAALPAWDLWAVCFIRKTQCMNL